ncbi:MAG: molybdopterin-dependent oxidoreductase, partial [Candidatus Acetothermia bacterium]
MEAYVENGRIKKVEGAQNQISNRGRLCPKGLSSVDYQYDPNRLTHPLKRTGSRGSRNWEKISWDEAIEIVGKEIKKYRTEYGPESIIWHRGQAPGWGFNWSLVQRFMNALGSPNATTHDHLCAIPRKLAHKHTYGGTPAPDYENASLIVLWGFNPMETSLLHHGKRIIEAKKRGAGVIAIDPRFSKTAMKTDMAIRPRPGTDGALALAVLKYLVDEGLYDRELVSENVYGFDKLVALIKRTGLEKASEITGVPQKKINGLASAIAENSPGTVIQDGNGIEQHTNVVQTTRALASIRGITGNLGIRGGHVFPRDLNLKDLTLNREVDKEQLYRESLSEHPLFYRKKGVTSPEVLDALETGKPYR